VKSNFVFFLGLFAALGISWWGIVLGSNAQLGGLAPYYDDTEGSSFPQWFPGAAARGQLVYKDLGCAACHTQQVRRPGFGSDQARGWGDRQSVARDYIYQPYPQLGLSRIGPDLTNVGDRKPSAPDADDLLHLLFTGADGMPSYRFLFENRRIGSGAQASDDALKLTGALEPKAGWEIVPTPRAQALAAYLVNLKTSYDYPESVPLAPAKPAAAPASGKGAPAAAAPGAPPAPAAAAPTQAGGAAPAKTNASTPASPASKPAPPPGTAPTPAQTAASPASGAAAAPGAAPTPAPTAAGTPAAAPTAGAASPATPAPSTGPAAMPAAAGTPTAAPTAGAASPATPAPSTISAATPAAAGTPAAAPAAGAASPATPAPSAGAAAAPASPGASAPSPSPAPTPTGTPAPPAKEAAR
jgi:cytochrome c oxidase cbb3-type subunit II